ncbi:cyclophilin-like family protein [Streptomyces spiralis]|uniref:cyclophilin-like family protein n=1 Tax=Streptomyces spiralis TaxID=66376 RepID=UPI0036936DF4
MQIRIYWPAGHLTATLDDTPTTWALAKELPLVSTARTWGEEVYFDTGVCVPRETDARQVVEPGTITFGPTAPRWPSLDALALPHAPTPIPARLGVSPERSSRENAASRAVQRPRPDQRRPRRLATMRAGAPVRVKPLED